MRVQKFKTRDEQEIVGYIQCLELIFNNYQEIYITESFVLKLHSDMLVYSEKDIRHKGNYKFGSNRVEATDYNGNIIGVIFDPTPPYLVKKEMQELIDWYNWAFTNKVKHLLILIANFIFEYLAIHPFQDGNGRTSRLLTNLLLLKHGYLFTQIVSHERIIEANKTDYLEDITSWLKFFLNIVKLQSTQVLQIIEEDNIVCKTASSMELD
nr:Fic family protein [Rickettsia endosymbiont of Ceutorhynchus assimilis]